MNLNFDTNALLVMLSTYGLKLLGALAIFVIGRWLSLQASRLAARMLTRAHVDSTLVSFAEHIVYALLLLVVVVAAISNIGVETTSIAAMLAAAGLAVGLALQGSLANLAAGVMIILFRPFRIGDAVQVANENGTVHDINIFTTVLKTPDNKTIIIPNGAITSGNITNFSAEATRRIDLTITVSYHEDLRTVKKILLQIASENARVMKEPVPYIAVSALADTHVKVVMQVWVKTPDHYSVTNELQEAVMLAFEKEKIAFMNPPLFTPVALASEPLKKVA